ncbi:hypothetical protein Cni_G02945 [Canna indica]|uniref:Uncharacterized protein n=1 Tax=Canna indica TaxID=4628 RepID=A0AAQ3JRN7_9LILI|nr:hypothetical protein Cni_G02945 [Canna indica]
MQNFLVDHNPELPQDKAETSRVVALEANSATDKEIGKEEATDGADMVSLPENVPPEKVRTLTAATIKNSDDVLHNVTSEIEELNHDDILITIEGCKGSCEKLKEVSEMFAKEFLGKFESCINSKLNFGETWSNGGWLKTDNSVDRREINARNLIVLLDCQRLIKMLRKESRSPWFMKDILNDISDLDVEMNILDWVFIKREFNNEAHDQLAKKGIREKKQWNTVSSDRSRSDELMQDAEET